jgi:hypothetical protein
MKQITDLADFLHYVDQVIDIHQEGPVADRYRALLEVFEEYQEYRRSVGLGVDLESVTAAEAGGSQIHSPGLGRVH